MRHEPACLRPPIHQWRCAVLALEVGVHSMVTAVVGLASWHCPHRLRSLAADLEKGATQACPPGYPVRWDGAGSLLAWCADASPAGRLQTQLAGRSVGGALGVALRSSHSLRKQRDSGTRLGGLSPLCAQGPGDGVQGVPGTRESQEEWKKGVRRDDAKELGDGDGMKSAWRLPVGWGNAVLPAYPCTCYLYSSSSLLTYRSSLPPTYLPNYLSPSLPSTCLPVISVYLSSSFKYADLPIISTYHLPTHPPAHLPSTGLLLGRQGLIWV